MSEKIAPRDVLGKTLVELAEKDPNIVVLDADFWPASKIGPFKDRFPERFFEIGIAEQNMMGIAAGLCTVGFTCFTSGLCTFCSRRACDQVTVAIGIPRLNVKILGLYPGLFVGKNGATHQALEDIAIMRAIASMTVVQPADAVEMQQVIRFAARYDGPMYIRVARDPVPVYVPKNYKFQLGKSLTLREGKDLTIITCGELIGDSLEAADSLAKDKIEARVINMSSLKPIDEDAVVKAAEETRGIVTVDNHNIHGGLGSAVAEVASQKRPVKMRIIGVRDVFGRSGTNPQMKAKFGLQTENIVDAVMSLLEN